MSPPSGVETSMRQSLPFESSRMTLSDKLESLAQQPEAVNGHHENDKGKHQARHQPDNKLVISGASDELMSSVSVLDDFEFVQRTGFAADSDDQPVRAVARKKIAEGDRRLTIPINADDPKLEKFPTENNEVDRSDFISQERFSREPDQPYSRDYAEKESAARPSMASAEAWRGRLETDVQCCACGDNFAPDRILRLSCAHIYCRSCLKSFFLRAAGDESIFPPRCCREPIPFHLIQADMSERELHQFRSAETEFSTTDRTYCSKPRCGQFIPSSKITGAWARCPCGASTCTKCKMTFHSNDCPADSALQATLSLAKRKEWQRCPACRALVESVGGCEHMLCKCGAEFCYTCGQSWYTHYTHHCLGPGQTPEPGASRRPLDALQSALSLFPGVGSRARRAQRQSRRDSQTNERSQPQFRSSIDL